MKDVYRIYQGIESYTFIPEKKARVKGESITIKDNKYTNIKSKIVPIDLETIDQLSPYLLKSLMIRKK